MFQNSYILVNNTTLNKKLPKSRQRIKQNSRILPEIAIEVMTHWYERNYSHPYPSYREFEMIAKHGQITICQAKQWFVNVRRRYRNQGTKNAPNKKQSPKKTNESDFTFSNVCQASVSPMSSYNYQYNYNQSIVQDSRYAQDKDQSVYFNSSNEQCHNLNEVNNSDDCYLSNNISSPHLSYDGSQCLNLSDSSISYSSCPASYSHSNWYYYNTQYNNPQLSAPNEYSTYLYE